MIDSLSIVVHVFVSRIMMSFSVDKKLLPRFMNLSTDFSEPPFKVEMSPFLIKTYILCFDCIHTETYTTCCLLQTMQQLFGLGWCICKKCYVCDGNSFSRISSASKINMTFIHTIYIFFFFAFDYK